MTKGGLRGWSGRNRCHYFREVVRWRQRVLCGERWKLAEQNLLSQAGTRQVSLTCVPLQMDEDYVPGCLLKAISATYTPTQAPSQTFRTVLCGCFSLCPRSPLASWVHLPPPPDQRYCSCT
ncbi:unnamed protein product, partial [Ectocarpus sp. 12 AP-2014]